VVHVQPFGQSFNDTSVVGFGEGHDVSIGLSEHRVDHVNTIRTTEVEVVGEDSQKHVAWFTTKARRRKEPQRLLP
jgi:hypothetical protein